MLNCFLDRSDDIDPAQSILANEQDELDDTDSEFDIVDLDELVDDRESQVDPVVLDLVDMMSGSSDGGGQRADGEPHDASIDNLLTGDEEVSMTDNDVIVDENDIFPEADTGWTFGEPALCPYMLSPCRTSCPLGDSDLRAGVGSDGVPDDVGDGDNCSANESDPMKTDSDRKSMLSTEMNCIEEETDGDEDDVAEADEEDGVTDEADTENGEPELLPLIMVSRPNQNPKSVPNDAGYVSSNLFI